MELGRHPSSLFRSVEREITGNRGCVCMCGRGKNKVPCEEKKGKAGGTDMDLERGSRA